MAIADCQPLAKLRVWVSRAGQRFPHSYGLQYRVGVLAWGQPAMTSATDIGVAKCHSSRWRFPAPGTVAQILWYHHL